MAIARFVDGVVADGAPPATPTWLAGALPTTTAPADHPIAPRLRLRSRPALSVDVALRPGETVHGFGAGAVGAPTRNGQRLRLMNLDTLFYGIEGATYASFPIFWVRGPEGAFCVFVVTALPLDVEVDAPRGAVDGAVRLRACRTPSDAVADVVVLTGSPAEILADLRALTGPAFVPPAWALGFHQSRWSYRTADEVRAVARRFRDENIPLDVIHLDIHFMDNYRVFTWHPVRFPDPAGLHRDLSRAGVRTLAIVDPGVAVGGSPIYDELARIDGFLKASDGATVTGNVWPGATVFPDFGRADVAATWARFHSILTDAGVSGVWNDMNDPVFRVGVVYDPLALDVTHAAAAPAPSAPASPRVPHFQKRNLYANEMAAAAVQGLLAARPNERPFVLSRSGFCGIQRSAALWTGDNFSSWEQLRENLHMVVDLGLSGVPLSGADIGGFGGRRGKYGIVKTKPPSELFVRWLELGAWMPFCRVHSVLYGPRQEPWSFSDDVTRLSRAILRRRYRHLPLLLSLARTAAATGLPLVRPLWLHHDVPAVHAALAATQVLVGEDLLFAPVLEKGVRRRRVWLPPGAWLDQRDGRVHGAVQTAPHGDGIVVEVDAPLGDPPLFLRAGTPWFTVAGGKNADETLASAIALEVLAPSRDERTATLVLEDGVNRRDDSFVLRARVVDVDGTLHVTLQQDARGFSPPQERLTLRVPTAFTTAVVDGVPLPLTPTALTEEDRRVTCATVTVPLATRELLLT